MQIPQIRLHQTYAQIGLRTIQAKQEIQHIPAELSIKQIPAQMEVHTERSNLEIDQKEAFNELGFKSTSLLSAEMAEYSKQEGLEAIAQISQEGDQLAAIENKTDTFAAIALEKGSPPPADFNIAFIPSYGSVKLHYTPAEVHINWKLGGAEIEATPHKLNVNYIPGKTEIYLRQREHLQIDFVGINVNSKS